MKHLFKLIVVSYIKSRGLTLSDVGFVDEAWQHVAVIDAEVVMGTEHVGGDHRCIAAAVLLEIGPVQHRCSVSGRSEARTHTSSKCKQRHTNLLWTSIILFAYA